jgi:hypothetical protein
MQFTAARLAMSLFLLEPPAASYVVAYIRPKNEFAIAFHTVMPVVIELNMLDRGVVGGLQCRINRHSARGLMAEDAGLPATKRPPARMFPDVARDQQLRHGEKYNSIALHILISP